MKTLVLLSQIGFLDRPLYSRMREITKGTSFKLGYIPSKTDRDRFYFHKSLPFFQSIGVTEFLYFDVDEEYDGSLRDELLTCDGVYLSGGNTFSFLNNLKEHRLLECICDMVEAGKPLMGVSAGAMIMAETIKMAEHIDENIIALNNLSALGLVPFEFMPHWEKKSSLLNQLQVYSNQSGKKVYACSDGAGMVVTAGDIEIFGLVEEINPGREVECND